MIGAELAEIDFCTNFNTFVRFLRCSGFWRSNAAFSQPSYLNHLKPSQACYIVVKTKGLRSIKFFLRDLYFDFSPNFHHMELLLVSPITQNLNIMKTVDTSANKQTDYIIPPVGARISV